MKNKQKKYKIYDTVDEIDHFFVYYLVKSAHKASGFLADTKFPLINYRFFEIYLVRIRAFFVQFIVLVRQIIFKD